MCVHAYVDVRVSEWEVHIFEICVQHCDFMAQMVASTSDLVVGPGRHKKLRAGQKLFLFRLVSIRGARASLSGITCTHLTSSTALQSLAPPE